MASQPGAYTHHVLFGDSGIDESCAERVAYFFKGHEPEIAAQEEAIFVMRDTQHGISEGAPHRTIPS